jgi:hypothetical protein
VLIQVGEGAAAARGMVIEFPASDALIQYE